MLLSFPDKNDLLIISTKDEHFQLLFFFGFFGWGWSLNSGLQVTKQEFCHLCHTYSLFALEMGVSHTIFLG
jgi:hypothetical protein